MSTEVAWIRSHCRSCSCSLHQFINLMFQSVVNRAHFLQYCAYFNQAIWNISQTYERCFNHSFITQTIMFQFCRVLAFWHFSPAPFLYICIISFNGKRNKIIILNSCSQVKNSWTEHNFPSIPLQQHAAELHLTFTSILQRWIEE